MTWLYLSADIAADYVAEVDRASGWPNPATKTSTWAIPEAVDAGGVAVLEHPDFPRPDDRRSEAALLSMGWRPPEPAEEDPE